MSREEVIRLIEQGEALLADERYEQALDVFERLIRLAPMEPLGYVGKAQTLVEMGHEEAGLATLDGALARQPQESVYLFTKCELLEGLGRYEEAKAAYRQANEMGPPEHVGGFGEQGEMLEHLEAALAASRGADMHLVNPAIWFDQARTLEMLGHYEEALAVCDQLIADAPEWIVPWYKKVELLNRLGRREEAEQAARHIRAMVARREAAAAEDEPDEMG